MRFLVTRGVGFIGSAVVRFPLQETNHRVINVDKLTYVGKLESLSDGAGHPRYALEQVDIDHAALERVFRAHRPDVVMYLAAESHVDHFIAGPAEFIQTNIVGLGNLLETAKAWWSKLNDQSAFRFHHIATDEVYGSLGESLCGSPGGANSMSRLICASHPRPSGSGRRWS